MAGWGLSDVLRIGHAEVKQGRWRTEAWAFHAALAALLGEMEWAWSYRPACQPAGGMGCSASSQAGATGSHDTTGVY